MKIIDFKAKGNVVRFYLGDDEEDGFWGDDWNDYPYECNAGVVYEKFIKGFADVYFPFGSLVLEPCSGEFESKYSKQDMKEMKVPCIIEVTESQAGSRWNTDFSYWSGGKDIRKFFFNDHMEPGVYFLRRGK